MRGRTTARSVPGMRSQRRTRWRRLAGVVLALFGVFALIGGLFVPLQVIVADPSVVPAPESWVAGWVIGLGVLVVVWPSRRRQRDGA